MKNKQISSTFLLGSWQCRIVGLLHITWICEWIREGRTHLRLQEHTDQNRLPILSSESSSLKAWRLSKWTDQKRVWNDGGWTELFIQTWTWRFHLPYHQTKADEFTELTLHSYMALSKWLWEMSQSRIRINHLEQAVTNDSLVAIEIHLGTPWNSLEPN